MMSNILPFPSRVAKPKTDEYLGGCPVCGRVTGFFNVGGDHWSVCHADLTKWRIGHNLFSAWRDEPESLWRRNAKELTGFVEVEPVYPEKEAGGAR